MPKNLVKLKGFNSKLPTKICNECGKPFQYRKKWKEVWSEVKFCSTACKSKSKNNKHSRTSL